MSVAVYSRLGELLQARKMTMSDLQGQIAARFRLSVGVRALDRLTREPRVRRPDMEVAAAAVLGVGLGDLFAVDVTPLHEHDAVAAASPEEDDALLDAAQRQRLSTLFDLQDRRPLTGEEQAESDRLVAAYGRAVSERGIHELARRRGVPIEQARRRSSRMSSARRLGGRRCRPIPRGWSTRCARHGLYSRRGP